MAETNADIIYAQQLRARIDELERDNARLRGEAAAYRADFERELEGGRELRKHLGAMKHEPIWTAAERVKHENNILKDALMRILASTDADAIQAIARRAQVTVWGEG